MHIGVTCGAYDLGKSLDFHVSSWSHCMRYVGILHLQSKGRGGFQGEENGRDSSHGLHQVLISRLYRTDFKYVLVDSLENIG